MATARSLHHAVFESKAHARDALDKLGAAGVPAGDIEVRSSIPIEHDLCPVGAELNTRVPFMAVLGGLLGGTAMFMLASLTAQAYRLPTGGMPIVALPPTGVITFEGVAIGAILFTVATVLREAGLPRFGGPHGVTGPFDDRLAAGAIIVTVLAAEISFEGWASKALATDVQSVTDEARVEPEEAAP